MCLVYTVLARRRLFDRGVTEDDEEGGGLHTMADDAFDLTGDEDTAATETPDDAGDDESVDEGSLLGDDKLAGDKGHASDDQHGTIGEEA